MRQVIDSLDWFPLDLYSVVGADFVALCPSRLSPQIPGMGTGQQSLPQLPRPSESLRI